MSSKEKLEESRVVWANPGPVCHVTLPKIAQQMRVRKQWRMLDFVSENWELLEVISGEVPT